MWHDSGEGSKAVSWREGGEEGMRGYYKWEMS